MITHLGLMHLVCIVILATIVVVLVIQGWFEFVCPSLSRLNYFFITLPSSTHPPSNPSCILPALSSLQLFPVFVGANRRLQELMDKLDEAEAREDVRQMAKVMAAGLTRLLLGVF
jgi:hypothetical protein